jgi:cytochrome o ubiquinol oxidase subunit III
MSETVSHNSSSKTIFGFWIYLLTDGILFATLFATYAVLHNNTVGGPSARELLDLPFALVETLILLTNSFVCGLAGLADYRNDKKWVMIWFGVVFLLGIAFLGMEMTEFSRLVQSGNSWQRSGFLSSFFTLVGTHGLHVAAGLLWIIVLMPQVFRLGLTPVVVRRLTCLRLFWIFSNVVWIFVFTFVYLMGAQHG